MAGEVKKVRIPVVLTDLIELRDAYRNYGQNSAMPFELSEAIRIVLLNMDFER